MSDIKPKYKGSMLRPLKALAGLWREPLTLPIEPRPAEPRYRGFHLNDWEQCIGCSTCQQICDNAAIRMVEIPGLPADPVKGLRPHRPVIDYGRCCWCALCVDICPSGSLSLSREYIHIGRDLNGYLILPDANGMHGLGYPKGWAKSDDADLLDLVRKPMAELDAAARREGFDEIVAGYDEQTALLEASRCVQCGLCHDACPANMHVPEYIRAIWSGDLEEAVAQIYRTNPFPHVCGRVCTRRCEEACSIGVRGAPLAIRWLKRHAVDTLPPAKVKRIAARGKARRASGRRVAVVGSGPAGLTVAYDLAKRGHAAVVFEALAEPGGMLRYGIPRYRLPVAKLDADIAAITGVGVEIRCNQRIGEAISLAALRREFDAVVFGSGLHLGRSTRIPGSDHPQVARAVDLLRAIAEGRPPEPPRQAVVIGGGNVAMDIARSLARLQRMAGRAVAVTVTALEARAQLLADPDEIREAAEEGIEILPGRGPRQVRLEAGAPVGLETVRCLSVFDDQGRFHPQYDDSDLVLHPADLVVEAIGQNADTGYLDEALTEALAWAHGRMVVDRNGRTAVDGLWACGDLVEGPDVIHAVAAGHRVAADIDRWLERYAPSEPAAARQSSEESPA